MAPEMVSTSTEPASWMAAGSSSMAREPTPSVSSSPTAETERMAFSSTVMVTVTGPPKPSTVAEYSPGV